MTTSDFRKMIKQLKSKPWKLTKYLKHNAPKKRSAGMNRVKCTRCGRLGAHIGKYGLHLCRQCFRDIALNIGFKKYS